VWRLDPPEPLPEKRIDEDALPADPNEAFELAGKKVVRRYANQIKYCYERELVKRPDLSGEIEIQVSIGPDGRVINARVARSTLSNPQVEQCVVSRFLRMEFMAPPSGGVEVLRLPYAFGTE
jgi:TonB family protein